MGTCWRVLLALQAEFVNELERMITEGILEPIDEREWVSNMAIVYKPSDGVRICCNLTEVNKAVITDRYLWPKLDDLGRVFSRSKFFSKLDV